MKNLKLIISVFLLMAVSVINLSAQEAQERRSARLPRARATRPSLVNSLLTGTYRLDTARGQDARAAATQATSDLPPEVRQRVLADVMSRLESPDMLAIEQRGSSV